MDTQIIAKNKRKKTGIRIMVIFLLVVVAIVFISMLDSRFRFVAEDFEISVKNLPEAFEGFRIVQISDLHGESFGRGNGKLLEAVRDEKPDIIALTGDFIDDPGELPEFGELCAALVKIAPVYFVSGNHDWASGLIEEIARILKDTGVRYLRNEYVEITRAGESVILAGVEDPNGHADMKTPPELIAELRREYPDEPVVLLGHRNYWLDVYPRLDIDLVLCGHAHGGLVRLPFVGGIFGTSSNLFPKYTNGAYEGSRYTMLVSRGLGNAVPLPRIFNNAHMPTAVLTADGGY